MDTEHLLRLMSSKNAVKQLVYYLFKYWVLIGLYCYHRRIGVSGEATIPQNKPVLFLSNHQNALIDVLLIATFCRRKPWFLTRADVFKNGFLRSFFGFLRMLPIYRIRDGRESLGKNYGIFKQCGQILDGGGAILIFPEANHNLQRRVRPLSKGFTRIVAVALEQNPHLDLQLVPVGQNYENATELGTDTSLHFGKPLAVRELNDTSEKANTLCEKVAASLRTLTTHVEPNSGYDQKLMQLIALDADFTNPSQTNALLENLDTHIPAKRKKNQTLFWRFLFYGINSPLVGFWRLLLKPKVPEPEFMATYRFGFAMLAYPFFYGICTGVLAAFSDWHLALLMVLTHFLFNLILIKWIGITSSAQRK